MSDWREFFYFDHAQYCPAKNTKRALVFVAYFVLAGLGGWMGLHKAPAPRDPIILSLDAVLVAVFAKAIVDFTCLRDRLVFGIALVMRAATLVERLAPSIYGQYLVAGRFGRLALTLIGVAISLSMLLQSVKRTHDGEVV